MVEAFKTNVPSQTQANSFLISLLKKFPSHKINFDLDDCDKILRVPGKKYFSLQKHERYASMEMHSLIKNGQHCVLPDTSHEVFTARPDLINKIAILGKRHYKMC